jgi:hypothetical protein
MVDKNGDFNIEQSKKRRNDMNDRNKTFKKCSFIENNKWNYTETYMSIKLYIDTLFSDPSLHFMSTV